MRTEVAPSSNAASPLLDVRSLSVSFGPLQATRNVTFALRSGERVGIVGESGCGKTVTGLALAGLLPRGHGRVAGTVMFEGRNLVDLPERDLRAVRGRRIAMIFQEPMSSLDPVFTVGEQIAETLRTHFKMGRREARERGIDALARVGMPLPARRYDEYPHQLSGGMCQRVMIAIALACEPQILIADEPTTALDVTVQAQILELLLRIVDSTGMALLMITHNIGLVAEACTRVMTMYAGEVVEDGAADDVLSQPSHPYTSALLRSLPQLSARRAALPSIPGRVPGLESMPAGCRFAPRCSDARPPCGQPQTMGKAAFDHRTLCGRHSELTLPGVGA
jgi:peptide/nickel transport system ATP-binding protein